MKFGFLIDHRKCIGCHACSVACKEEHQVPLGVYRTWVKYVEKGAFPIPGATSPCCAVTIGRRPLCDHLPVTALYKRSDGIVDFNPNACIGCKACMQACPYDALYIDPNSNTAAKCNFCAHRIKSGPAGLPSRLSADPGDCIGHLDDPTSLHLPTLQPVNPLASIKPEKGTKPQLSYIDADESSLTPGATIQPQEVWHVVGGHQPAGHRYSRCRLWFSGPWGPAPSSTRLSSRVFSAEQPGGPYTTWGTPLPWGKNSSLTSGPSPWPPGPSYMPWVSAPPLSDSPLLSWGAPCC